MRYPVQYLRLTAHDVGMPVIIATEVTNGQGSSARSVSIHRPRHVTAIQLQAVAVAFRSDVCRFIHYFINHCHKICRVLISTGILFLVWRSAGLRECVDLLILSFDVPQVKIEYVTLAVFYCLLELAFVIIH